MSRNKDAYRLWQHTNGTYYILWTARTEVAPGQYRSQSKRVSTGTTDRTIAEQYRAQYITDLANPEPQAEPTIGYLLERYRKEHGVNTRSLETMDYHLKVLNPFFGNLLPRQVSNILLRQYANQRAVSDGTILRELGTLKAALNYAAGNRWIESLPHFSMPVKQPPPRDLWLTREEVGTLIKTAKSNHIKLFIQIAVATAARSGAILDLTWPQIDLEKKLIDFGRGWGNKHRTTVPINDRLYESLKSAQELRQSDYVIEYNAKRIFSIKAAFRRLCKECCIKASPHVLRHSAATWLIMDGVPLSEVARLLGDSEKTVEKVYGKHAPDYLRRAVNSLNFG